MGSADRETKQPHFIQRKLQSGQHRHLSIANQVGIQMASRRPRPSLWILDCDHVVQNTRRMTLIVFNVITIYCIIMQYPYFYIVSFLAANSYFMQWVAFFLVFLGVYYGMGTFYFGFVMHLNLFGTVHCHICGY